MTSILMEWMQVLFVLSVFFLETECSGKIWLKLINFNNGRGKGANGHYCDGKFFIRGSDCDHRFVLCFDTVDGPQNTNRCAYGRLRTVTVYNTNSITFGSRFGQLSNPMTVSFNRWSGSFKLKVDVYDDDDNRDDYVDFLHYSYYKPTPYYNESVAVKTDISIRHRVTFNVQMKVYCDPDYYGNGCDIYCKPTQKYTCYRQTGSKICLEDWTGPDCNVRRDACLSTPCKNQATCHNSMGSYLCVCQEGYTGTQCEQDVDECVSSPCKNNGTCNDLLNNYKCTCPKGFRGQDCGDLIDWCSSRPCLNNGSCHMDPNDVKFHCDCPDEYDGPLCDTDIDECAIDICKNGATCENSLGSFKCHCNDGWKGDTCESDIDECLESSCFGTATCLNTNGSFICSCDLGYKGALCDVDIDECSNSPCLNGGDCHDQLNGFTCGCPVGYTGNLCQEEIDECSGKPCMHNGSCFDLVGSFMCYCNEGWTGNTCERDVDECFSSPCRNHGECINTNGSFYCQCPIGWTGAFCQEDVDECKTAGCQNRGTCFNQVGDFKCQCENGFSGKTCNEDIDECLGFPCENNSTCTNTFGSFSCKCLQGFNGNDCSLDINECLSSPCENNSTCTNTFGSFSCKCLQGFKGNDCSLDINECLSSPCDNNAICIDGVGHFQCKCPLNYEGHTCSDGLDPCRDVNCSNDGVCISSGSSYSCRCKIGFTGDFCQDKDKSFQIVEENHSNRLCVEEHGENILIILDDVVTMANEEKVVSDIKEIIQKHSIYDTLNITRLDIKNSCSDDERSKECRSNITFSVAINGSLLCGEDRQKIQNLLRDNGLFKLQSSGVSNQISRAMFEKQHLSKKTWFASNWYVVAIVIGILLVAIGVLLFVMVRHKRRKQLMYLQGECYTSNSISWHSGSGASNTLPSLAFDNDLYTTALQEQQATNTSTPIQENPDLAFDNNMYQQVIPQEQTKLMTFDVDRFEDEFQ